MYAAEYRQADRDSIARDLGPAKLAVIGQKIISLGQTLALASELLDGKVRGRMVLDVNR